LVVFLTSDYSLEFKPEFSDQTYFIFTINTKKQVI